MATNTIASPWGGTLSAKKEEKKAPVTTANPQVTSPYGGALPLNTYQNAPQPTNTSTPPPSPYGGGTTPSTPPAPTAPQGGTPSPYGGNVTFQIPQTPAPPPGSVPSPYGGFLPPPPSSNGGAPNTLSPQSNLEIVGNVHQGGVTIPPVSIEELRGNEAGPSQGDQYAGQAADMWKNDIYPGLEKGLNEQLSNIDETYRQNLSTGGRRAAEMNASMGRGMGGGFGSAMASSNLQAGREQVTNKNKAYVQHQTRALNMKMAYLDRLLKQAEASKDRDLKQKIMDEMNSTQIALKGMDINALSAQSEAMMNAMGNAEDDGGEWYEDAWSEVEGAGEAAWEEISSWV